MFTQEKTEETKLAAKQLTIDMWNAYTKYIISQVRFASCQVKDDEKYLKKAQEEGRTKANICKREIRAKRNRQELERLRGKEKVVNTITLKMVSNDYDVMYEKYQGRETHLMAVLIFRDIKGKDYYFRCGGGYYGSPHCEGSLNIGLPQEYIS